MFTWHMMCTTHKLKADMVNKIVIKIFIWDIEMSHQHLYLKNQIKQKLIIWIKKKTNLIYFGLKITTLISDPPGHHPNSVLWYKATKFVLPHCLYESPGRQRTWARFRWEQKQQRQIGLSLRQKNSTATHLFSCYFDMYFSFEKSVLD